MTEVLPKCAPEDGTTWSLRVWTGLVVAFDGDEEAAQAHVRRCIKDELDFCVPGDPARSLQILLGARH